MTKSVFLLVAPARKVGTLFLNSLLHLRDETCAVLACEARNVLNSMDNVIIIPAENDLQEMKGLIKITTEG